MAFPAIVQTKTSGAFASAVTSTSLQFDSTPTAGNLVVAFVAIDKAPGTITVPTGWTKHQEHTTGTGVSGCICSWEADGTNPSHTWSWPNSGCRPTIVMYEVSVSGGSPAVFATAKDTTNASASARTSGSIDAGSTTEADSLVIAGVFNDTHTSWDAGSRSWSNSFSDLTFYGGGSGFSGEPGVITAYKEIATAGGGTDSVFSYTGDLADQIIGFSMVIALDAGATSYTLTADAGSVAITGTAANLERHAEVAAAPGSYAVTGVAANLEYHRDMPAAAGAWTISGTAATLLADRRLNAEPGAVAITGTAANLEAHRKVAADAGSVAITGTDADLSRGKRIAAEAGAFDITGTAAALLADRVLTAEAGTVDITGTAADLVVTSPGAYTLACDPGAFTIAGTDAAFLRDYVSPLDAGAYAITGTGATLSVTPVTPEAPAAGGGNGGASSASRRARRMALRPLYRHELEERRRRRREERQAARRTESDGTPDTRSRSAPVVADERETRRRAAALTALGLDVADARRQAEAEVSARREAERARAEAERLFMEDEEAAIIALFG